MSESIPPTSNEETNRDKALRGEPVPVTDGRLSEMQEQAIAAEGIGLMGPLHWHWASAINELIAARAEIERLTRERDAALTPAARDVLAERRRQIEAEGWHVGHDDDNDSGQLAKAAACYVLYGHGAPYESPGVPIPLWSWGEKWWKPKNRRRDLVRAGALILAEIERLDRLSGAPKSSFETGADPGCPIHGPCVICEAQKQLGDPRETATVSAQQNVLKCPRCGGDYFSIPRMGIWHACPDGKTPTPDDWAGRSTEKAGEKS